MDLAKLAALSKKIVEPEDYYKGSSLSYPLRPTNLLCFHREDAEELNSPKDKVRDYHHRYVLVTAMEGHGYICVDTKKFHIREGESMLIFPFQFHHYFAVQPKHITWVFVTFEMLESGEIEGLRLSPPRDLGQFGEMALESILQMWTTRKSSHPSIGYHTALLLYHLRNLKTSHSRNPKSGISVDSSADLLTKVNQYLIPRLNRPCPLREISAAVNMSESHLRASFQKLTGTGLGTHVRLLRMQKAAGMLLQTGLTVSEISDKCGFDSVYSFSRSFKLVYGISPRTYREKFG